MKLSYEQAWQRVTTAYSNNELNPYNCSACDVGNLLGGNAVWAARANARYGVISGEERDNFTNTYSPVMLPNGVSIPFLQAWEEGDRLISEYGYDPEDIVAIETSFLETLQQNCPPANLFFNIFSPVDSTAPEYEEALFKAMVASLEELKRIHISHGEVIDEETILTKRALKPVLV